MVRDLETMHYKFTVQMIKNKVNEYTNSNLEKLSLHATFKKYAQLRANSTPFSLWDNEMSISFLS